ncbi:MAG: 2-oxo acid dehydrogenase subunit E2 [Anaeromyxobacteraceae bacterium]
MQADGFETRPFPRSRHDVVDALEVGVRRHVVHAILELDVTAARARLATGGPGGGKLSFTAFLVASLARAIDADRLLHACRDWRGRLVLFEDVDVVTLVEAERGGVAVPHVIRAANRRSALALHEELRRVQAEPRTSAQRSGALARLSRFVPGVARRAFLRALRRSPRLMKRSAGTALVTSVGMFGTGGGWAIGIVPLHTLALTVGAVAWRPWVVDGRVEPREILPLTLSIDHDVVDGAPAARFAARLREIVEEALVLQEPPLPPEQPRGEGE